MVNASAGLQGDLYPKIKIPLLEPFNVSWDLSLAQGVMGTRYDLVGSILGGSVDLRKLFRNNALAELGSVIGTAQNDQLTGNTKDNTFDISAGGANIVDGGDKYCLLRNCCFGYGCRSACTGSRGR